MATAAMAGTKETIMGTMAFITPRVTRRRSAHLAPATAQSLYEDPLDADRSNDMVVATTRRSLCRVALIASETATRFAREGLLHDPMAWLLAPRALFSGSTTLEACLERGHCEHAILLHGLSLGFDASPPRSTGLSPTTMTPTGTKGATNTISRKVMVMVMVMVMVEAVVMFKRMAEATPTGSRNGSPRFRASRPAAFSEQRS